MNRLKSKQRRSYPSTDPGQPMRAEQQPRLPPGDPCPAQSLYQAAVAPDLSKMTSTLMLPQPDCVFIIFFVSFIQMFRIQQMLFSKPALLFLRVFEAPRDCGGGGRGGRSRWGGRTCCPELLLRLLMLLRFWQKLHSVLPRRCLPVSQCKRRSQWPFVPRPHREEVWSSGRN